MSKEKKNLTINTVRAFVVFLLAIVVAISVTVAWFADSKTVTATGMQVKVENESITIEDDDPLSGELVLPCLTKYKDTEISVNDFSKTLLIKTFTVIYDESDSESDILLYTTNSNDIHCFIDTEYDSDRDSEYYANYLYSNEDKIDNDATISYGDGILTTDGYRKQIALVFYGDYTDSHYSTIKSNGEIGFSSILNAEYKD